MQVMGIDVGTTTISIILMDRETRSLRGKRTIVHQAFIQGKRPEHRVQDPGRLWEAVKQGMQELEEEYGKPDCIGLTGQMHGILYVDARGEAVSPLYTWQDQSGDVVMEDGSTCGQLLKKRTGNVATGYGLTTHFYLQRRGEIPVPAVKMVTISDYVGMKLCSRAEPVIARDMAASWGCFNLEKGDFFRDELTELGVDISYLPGLAKGHGPMGMTPEKIPVMVSLGDNQASVAGSVGDLRDAVVLNIGTGGQYEVMERQAREFLREYGKERAWKIRTTFSGSRSSPGERGYICGIGVDNFRPGAMTAGMMLGILGELYEMYGQMCEMTGKKAGHLVGSGNGI